MPGTVAVATLPARSATVAVAERLSPSPSMTVSAGHAPAMPESGSSQVQCTTTSPRYQPSAFGCVVTAPEIVGAVLSMLMSLTVTSAVLSAASTAVPVTDWFAPSASIFVSVHEAMPDRASSHENEHEDVAVVPTVRVR